MSMFREKKPYSAITVTIENLTGESHNEEDLSGIPDLVEVISLQPSGPTEAARAIRKKLKYGTPHRQIRALVLLDGLIQNAGPRFQRAFLDEALLERLRVCGTSELSDPDVKKKCRELFRSWAQFSSTQGLNSIAQLHKELPKRKVIVTQEKSKVIRETEENPFGDDEEEEARNRTSQGASAGKSSSATAWPKPTHKKAKSSSGGFFGSSSKDKKVKTTTKGKKFNLEAEKEQMKVVIADASITSTNLLNAMQSINRETERISDNQDAVKLFEACKTLRRRVLRYIHNVDSEQWLGSLLNANDALVHSLMSFEQLDCSIDADSDSDDELAEQAHAYRMATMRHTDGASDDASPTFAQHPDLSDLGINPPVAPPRPSAATKPPPPQPPRPVPVRQDTEPEDDEPEEDEDDPFGDKNVVETPAFEQAEPKW